MNNQTTQEKFAALKKMAKHVTTEDILQRGLEVLEATGLPLEDVAALARSVGIDLEDVAYTVGDHHGVPHRVPPVQTELELRRTFSEKIGKPGRPTTTRDLAEFAYDRRPLLPWKEIAVEWKRLNPQDTRKITLNKIKDAYRRAYGPLRTSGRH